MRARPRCTALRRLRTPGSSNTSQSSQIWVSRTSLSGSWSRVLIGSGSLYSSYHGPMALPVEFLHGISREAINELPVRRYGGEVRLIATPDDVVRAPAACAPERVVGFDTA